ncbi:hypothetical protein CSPX01_10022 [Colletotrichum filicis]|nr:hypothetical protein CSPX01_10022 [Colletotrichum filicis]
MQPSTPLVLLAYVPGVAQGSLLGPLGWGDGRITTISGNSREVGRGLGLDGSRLRVWDSVLGPRAVTGVNLNNAPSNGTIFHMPCHLASLLSSPQQVTPPPSSHWSDSQRTTMARALFAPHGNVRMLLLLLLPLTPGSACNCVRNQQHPSLHPPFQLVFHFSTAKLYFPRTSHEPPAIPSSIRVGNDSSRLPHHTIGGDDAYGCLMLVKVAFTSGISVEKTYAECSELVHLEDSKIASALTHLALMCWDTYVVNRPRYVLHLQSNMPVRSVPRIVVFGWEHRHD